MVEASMAADVLASSAVDVAVARLERWLESMRGPDGYAGPVVHWWRDCLVFCGAGRDWRYEGIIAGYLTLFERTGNERWLSLAQRAGDDLLKGQREDGCFRNSRFELNPGIGGTPHEAACDIGLLLLAHALAGRGDAAGQPYAVAAERNLRDWYIARLWSDAEQRFRDDPMHVTFVPNKAATVVEALCLLADLRQDDEVVARYVRPTADAIVAEQVRAPGTPLDGAIAQNIVGRARIEKYFPYYQARCATGLIAAYQHLGDHRYLQAAIDAMRFVLRCREPDGGFPQAIYPGESANRFPRWIAATGDILRAADLLRPYGLHFPSEPTRTWLLAGQRDSGGIATARGFGAQVSQRPPTTADLRDELSVCGWADKAFRYLSASVTTDPSSPGPRNVQPIRCTFRGRAVTLLDDDTAIEVRHGGRVVYRWRKGTTWAESIAIWAVSA
jgi:hypothetical protein